MLLSISTDNTQNAHLRVQVNVFTLSMTSETPSDVTDEQIVAQLAQIVNAFRHYTSEYRSTLLKSGAHEVMDKHLKVSAFCWH